MSSPNKPIHPSRSPWITMPKPNLEVRRSSSLANILIGPIFVSFCFYKYFNITHPEISRSDLQRQVIVLWALTVAFEMVKILTTTLFLTKQLPKTNLGARMVVALLSGISYLGISILIVGAQTTSGNYPLTNYLKAIAYLLIFTVLGFLNPVKIKPANQYRWDDRFTLHRQYLDRILESVVNRPELMNTIKNYIRKNHGHLAVLELMRNGRASLDQARSLLPRIAAQDLT